MKRILFFLNQKKWLSVFLLSVLLLIVNFKTITDKLYFYLDQGYDRQSAELAHMINSVIGIPYCQQPQYRNDSPDIVRLSKDQWLAFPYRIKGLEIDLVEDRYNLVESMPSKEEAMHFDSLELAPIFYRVRFSQPVYRLLCGYFLTCKSLNISVQNEYLLQRPELLRNIIQIAERPCDYIRTIDEVKPGDEIIYSSSFGWRGRVFGPRKYSKKDIETGIKWAREKLDCDNKNFFTFPSIYHPSIKPRKFVLLVINESGIVGFKAEKSLNLLIERKDIN